MMEIEKLSMQTDGQAIRVLLVDDHAVVRQGLKMFLELDTGIEVVGEARDGVEAVEMAGKLQPAVVVMDLLMPKMTGIEATREIRRLYPEIEVLALTSVLDDNSVVEAIKSGATGYLLKNAQPEDLCQAIHAVASGKVQLSPEAATKLVREVCTETPPLESLTARERDVLKLLASGATNKQIASDLSIVEKTVKTHVSNVLSKLGLQSRTQAALYAVQRGWVGL
jgi:NarL family two-component system response regulator LiaR